MPTLGENSDAVPVEPVSLDHVSPELALVDPELAARARAALPAPTPPRAVPSAAHVPDARGAESRPYPFWARVTAALWLLVLGILIGGAAIPHAQDKPRVIPSREDPAFCPVPAPDDPTGPGR
jgi:hypothetical protein